MFVHLDVRSCFSLKEGAFTPEQLAAAAAELRLPAVALTDRDGLYGAATVRGGLRARGVRPDPGRVAHGARAHARGGRQTQTTRTSCCSRTTTWVTRTSAVSSPTRTCSGTAATLGRHGAALRARGRAWLRCSARAPTPAGSPSPAGSTPPRAWRRRSARPSAPIGCVVAVEHRLELDPTPRSARCSASPSGSSVPAVATNPVRYLVPEDAFLADALECMREIVPIASNHVSRRERRGLAEARGGDARAVRRASRPGRSHPRMSPSGARSTSACGGCTSRISRPRRPQRRRGARRAVLARRARARRPRDGGAPRPPAPRALDDPADGLRGLLPDGRRHRGRHQVDGDLRGVPGLGRGVARVLPDRDLRRRRAAARPRVRAVHEPDARRAARHRYRRRVGAARGRLRHGPVAPRRRAGRLRRDDRHVPRALGDPRGRQGARPARGRGRHRREGVPPHLGAQHPARASSGCRSSGGSTSRCASSSCCSGSRNASTGSPAHRVASVRDHPRDPRSRGARAARAERERPPDGPGRQGRRRAARLPEARRPRRSDALVDAPRDRRDREDDGGEDRSRPDPPRRRADVRADPRLRHARVLPDRVPGPARAPAEAPADALGRPDRRHLAVPARTGEVRHDPALHRAARRAASVRCTGTRISGRRCGRRSA